MSRLLSYAVTSFFCAITASSPFSYASDSNPSDPCNDALIGNMTKILEETYSPYRGVFGYRVIDGQPTVFAEDEQYMAALPKTEINDKPVQFQSITQWINLESDPTSKAGRGATLNEIGTIKDSLWNNLAKDHKDLKFWLINMSAGFNNDKTFHILVKVSDPEAAKYIPQTYQGITVKVEYSTPITFEEIPLVELIREKAEATAEKARHDKNLRKFVPGFQDIVVRKYDPQKGDGPYKNAKGYILELQMTELSPSRNDLPISYDGLMIVGKSR